MGMARRTRRRQPEEHGPSGFLVVDKPVGWTSHDVVDAARGWFSARRIGHLGTLDPQATGVLPLAIRGATKLVSFLPPMQKSYVGVVRLGEETDTLDGDGTVLRRHEGELPSQEDVLEALIGTEIVGEQDLFEDMQEAARQSANAQALTQDLKRGGGIIKSSIA